MSRLSIVILERYSGRCRNAHAGVEAEMPLNRTISGTMQNPSLSDSAVWVT